MLNNDQTKNAATDEKLYMLNKDQTKDTVTGE